MDTEKAEIPKPEIPESDPEEILTQFATDLVTSQKPLDPADLRLLEENIWDLV